MDIFDQIDRLSETPQFKRGAKIAAKLMWYNSKYNKNVSAKTISENNNISESIVKSVLAGIYNGKSCNKYYNLIENYINDLFIQVESIPFNRYQDDNKEQKSNIIVNNIFNDNIYLKLFPIVQKTSQQNSENKKASIPHSNIHYNVNKYQSISLLS